MNTNADNSNLTLRNKLQAVIDDEPNTIRAYVAKEALDYNETDPERMFRDLQSCGGCISGTINSLCFYNQTHRFFDKYYDEIEALREEYECEVGEPLKIKYDLKNFYAWYAFEHEAFDMACELGLDL